MLLMGEYHETLSYYQMIAYPSSIRPTHSENQATYHNYLVLKICLFLQNDKESI